MEAGRVTGADPPPLLQVLLPPWTVECGALHGSDPLNSSVDCEVAEKPLTKFLAKSLMQTEPQLFQFFLHYHVSSTDMTEFLTLYRNQTAPWANKTAKVEAAACQVRPCCAGS